MNFKEGMICFAAPKKAEFIQKAISFFTGSPFTHSFIVMPIDGVLHALETTATKVVCNPVEEKYTENNIIECWEAIDKIDQMEIFRRSLIARSIYEGEWYAYQSYVWFMYRWVARLFKKEPKKMWSWGAQLGPFVVTCTELTCKSLPLNLRPEQDMNTVAPRELRDFFMNNQSKVKLVGVING